MKWRLGTISYYSPSMTLWTTPTLMAIFLWENCHWIVLYESFDDILFVWSSLESTSRFLNCKKLYISWLSGVNTLRLRQNGRHLAKDIFKSLYFLSDFHWSLFLGGGGGGGGAIAKRSSLFKVLASSSAAGTNYNLVEWCITYALRHPNKWKWCVGLNTVWIQMNSKSWK